jgi:cell division protease FtsH
MNNKGFNWFIPVLLGLILLIFLPGLLGDSMVKNIDEKEFYGLVQQGKVNEVMVYRDSFKADVYLTKEAKAELQKGEKKAIRFL